MRITQTSTNVLFPLFKQEISDGCTATELLRINPSFFEKLAMRVSQYVGVPVICDEPSTCDEPACSSESLVIK